MTEQRSYEDIPEWVRLDIAIEIISELLSEKRRLIRELTAKNEAKAQIEKHEMELELLIAERKKMYFGDEDILKKVINEYGAKVRKNFEGR